MNIADFDYALPQERIARLPLERRRDSRLLHLAARGSALHRHFTDLPGLLRPGDLLVVNTTRVIPARLFATRETGGRVEFLFLEELEPRVWRAIAKPARRLSAGDVLRIEEVLARTEEATRRESGAGHAFARQRSLHSTEALAPGCLRILGREENSFRVEFAGPGLPVLQQFGRVPLPPYMGRPDDAADRDRYQTVFAKEEGAVAAPTAGLHFDEAMLNEIRGKGVAIVPIVLHVGPGTFRPLPDEDVPLESIRLEEERFEVPPATQEAIQRTKRQGGRVVACGTTVVRSLESQAKGVGENGRTSLFIYPPFRFDVVDALLTNFHLPRSSLLCLVAAFAGRERILTAYEEAIRLEYRFYSYGDATFLERSE